MIALAGAERLLLKRAGVNQTQMEAIKAIVEAREKTHRDNVEARVSSSIERRRDRAQVKEDQIWNDGYAEGEKAGYDNARDLIGDQWEELLQHHTAQMHSALGHTYPVQWCRQGPCGFHRDIQDRVINVIG